jgi:hypothetical protein
MKTVLIKEAKARFRAASFQASRRTVSNTCFEQWYGKGINKQSVIEGAFGIEMEQVAIRV